MREHKDLIVWQKSFQLALDVYQATAAFPKEELYGMVSQMRRCAASIPANIAEGCGRYSEAEFLRFLDIALSSASELDTWILLSARLMYFATGKSEPLEAQLLEVRKMLIALIIKIRGDEGRSI